MIVVMVIKAIRVRRVGMGIWMARRAAVVNGLRGDRVILIQTMRTRARIVARVVEKRYMVAGTGTGEGGNGNRRNGGLQRWRGKGLARDAIRGGFSCFSFFFSF